MSYAPGKLRYYGQHYRSIRYCEMWTGYSYSSIPASDCLMEYMCCVLRYCSVLAMKSRKYVLKKIPEYKSIGEWLFLKDGYT